MMQNFTKLNLISYLYGELTIQESIRMTELLIVDSDLYLEFLLLSKMKEELDSVRLSPNKEVIDNILLNCQLSSSL